MTALRSRRSRLISWIRSVFVGVSARIRWAPSSLNTDKIRDKSIVLSMERRLGEPGGSEFRGRISTVAPGILPARLAHSRAAHVSNRFPHANDGPQTSLRNRLLTWLSQNATRILLDCG